VAGALTQANSAPACPRARPGTRKGRTPTPAGTRSSGRSTRRSRWRTGAPGRTVTPATAWPRSACRRPCGITGDVAGLEDSQEHSKRWRKTRSVSIRIWRAT